MIRHVLLHIHIVQSTIASALPGHILTLSNNLLYHTLGLRLWLLAVLGNSALILCTPLRYGNTTCRHLRAANRLLGRDGQIWPTQTTIIHGGHEPTIFLQVTAVSSFLLAPNYARNSACNSKSRLSPKHTQSQRVAVATLFQSAHFLFGGMCI